MSKLKTPGEAYTIGRKLPIREDWNDVKEAIMLDLLRKKFENPILAVFLSEITSEDIGEGWLASMLKQVRCEVIEQLKQDGV